MVSPSSGRVRGRGRGRAKWYAHRGGGCTTPPVHFHAVVVPVFFVLERPSRSAPAETEKTGATPTFYRWRGSANGGVWHPVYRRVYHHPTAFVGVAPVLMSPCGKAPPPARGRDDEPQRPARCVTDFSAFSRHRRRKRTACVWTWPGLFHGDPVAVLVPYNTPELLPRRRRMVRR